METQQKSAWAIGWATFAAAMLLLIGMFQVLAGIAAVANDDLYVVSTKWVFEFDITAWGWVHILLGIVLFLSGLGIFVGNVLARTVGVFVAMFSAVTNFAFIPYYPVWSIIMIAVNIAVIWALTAHGRDIVEDERS